MIPFKGWGHHDTANKQSFWIDSADGAICELANNNGLESTPYMTVQNGHAIDSHCFDNSES